MMMRMTLKGTMPFNVCKHVKSLKHHSVPPSHSNKESSCPAPRPTSQALSTAAHGVTHTPLQLFALDLETTVDSGRKRILELAICPVNATGKGSHHFVTLVNPGHSFAHNYTSNLGWQDVQGAPLAREAILRMIEYIQQSLKAGSVPVLIAHNGAKFDFPILQWEAEAAGVELPGNLLYLDSFKLCEQGGIRGRPGLADLKQQTLVQFYGRDMQRAPGSQPHRALADIEALAHILPQLLRDCTSTSAAGQGSDGEQGWQGVLQACLDQMQRAAEEKAARAKARTSGRAPRAPRQPEPNLVASLQRLSLSSRPAHPEQRELKPPSPKSHRQQQQQQQQQQQEELGVLFASSAKAAHCAVLEAQQLARAAERLQLMSLPSGSSSSNNSTNVVVRSVSLQAKPVLLLLRGCRVQYNINPKFQQENGRDSNFTLTLAVPPEVQEAGGKLDALVMSNAKSRRGKLYPIILTSGGQAQPSARLQLKVNVEKPDGEGGRALALDTEVVHGTRKLSIPLRALGAGSHEEVLRQNATSVNRHLFTGRTVDALCSLRAWESEWGAGVKLHAVSILLR